MYPTRTDVSTIRTLAAAVQDQIVRLRKEQGSQAQIAALEAALANLERALAVEASGMPTVRGKQYPFGPSELKRG